MIAEMIGPSRDSRLRTTNLFSGSTCGDHVSHCIRLLFVMQLISVKRSETKGEVRIHNVDPCLCLLRWHHAKIKPSIIAGDSARFRTEETGFGFVGIIVTTVSTDTTGKSGSDDRRKNGLFSMDAKTVSYVPKPKGTLPCYLTTYSLSTPANV